jgi:5'-nucleotidase (lipoprotein e(P4) family)
MKYHNNLDATTYFQTAAENRALYYQGFALAEMRLVQEMARLHAAGQPPESLYVVTDCDETVLDNSEYNAWLIETGREFHDASWSKWVATRRALATPGALEFAKFVVEHGCHLLYVSSRFEADREATADNLKSLGFPLPDGSADPARTFLYLAGMPIGGVPTKKKEQMEFLERRFGARPILQLGDNLSDHDAERYSSRVRAEQRAERSVQDERRWGADWIVFPNPIYGGWRQSLREPGSDALATDERPPAPFQERPVRPPVSPQEAPKLGLLRRWPRG